jgi:cytochrome P450
LQHPEQLGLARDGQVGGAVDEILRYAQAGTGFAGITYTVPAGAAVLVCLDSAARDERRVPDPQRFDITRGSAGATGPHTLFHLNLW